MKPSIRDIRYIKRYFITSQFGYKDTLIRSHKQIYRVKTVLTFSEIVLISTVLILFCVMSIRTTLDIFSHTKISKTCLCYLYFGHIMMTYIMILNRFGFYFRLAYYDSRILNFQYVMSQQT